MILQEDYKLPENLVEQIKLIPSVEAVAMREYRESHVKCQDVIFSLFVKKDHRYAELCSIDNNLVDPQPDFGVAWPTAILPSRHSSLAITNHPRIGLPRSTRRFNP
jgi:hypothetical protein